MKRKFKSGDRVKTTPNLPRFDYVGTVIGYDENELILVKFDDLTYGHNGSSYYISKGIKYDLNNHQHLYGRDENLCLLEGGIMNKKKLLAKLEDEIQKVNAHLVSIPENDYLERCITLGRINGLLTAELYVINLLEENELV